MHKQKEEFQDHEFSALEQEKMLVLDDQINRITMFSDFLLQYDIDYDNKCQRMEHFINSKFDLLVGELNKRRLNIQQSLDNIRKHKKLQIGSEIKSLKKYSEILKQKATVVDGLMKEAKLKNMDKQDRELAIKNIIDSKQEFDAGFDIYEDKFDIVSHFQMMITRPAVSFGEYFQLKEDDETETGAKAKTSKNKATSEQKQQSSNSNSNSNSGASNVESESETDVDVDGNKNKVDPMLNAIQNYGNIEEQVMKEFNELLSEMPAEHSHTQQIHDVVNNKVQMASSVYEHAKTNITNLRVKDLTELYNTTNPSEEIVVVFEALHIILNRVTESEWNIWLNGSNNKNQKKQKQKQKLKMQLRWTALKTILTEATFVPNLFNYNHQNLTARQKNILTNNYLQHPSMKYAQINRKSKAAGQLCHWIVSLVRLANFQTQLQSLSAELLKQEKDYEENQNNKKQLLQAKQAKLRKNQNKNKNQNQASSQKQISSYFD